MTAPARLPEMLTEQQAADALHVCTRTLRRLRQEGAIRFVAVTPRTIRYRIEDIEAFIENHSKVHHIPAPRTATRINRKRKGEPVIVSFTERRAQRRGNR